MTRSSTSPKAVHDRDIQCPAVSLHALHPQQWSGALYAAGAQLQRQALKGGKRCW